VWASYDNTYSGSDYSYTYVYFTTSYDGTDTWKLSYSYSYSDSEYDVWTSYNPSYSSTTYSYTYISAPDVWSLSYSYGSTTVWTSYDSLNGDTHYSYGYSSSYSYLYAAPVETAAATTLPQEKEIMQSRASNNVLMGTLATLVLLSVGYIMVKMRRSDKSVQIHEPLNVNSAITV